MASLIHRKKGGREYTYWVRSARVNGKPRIVEQVYLGPKDRVLEEIKAAYTRGKTPGVCPLKQLAGQEFGATAWLWHWADRLRLVEAVDRHVSPPPDRRRTSLSVGQYVVIAAVNRVLEPKSKRALYEQWYRHSVLSRLCPVGPDELSSQRFWDHMDQVDAAQIELIQHDVLARLAELFPLGQETILYDTTNFFTFIDTFNARTELAQRGENKQKRRDLRQLSLGLFEDRQTGLPLGHQCYAGNQPDVAQFPAALEALAERWMKGLQRPPEQLTLVFDRGHGSKANFEALSARAVHHVAGIPARWVPDLLEVGLEAYDKLELPNAKHVKVYRTTRKLWTRQRSLLAVFSPTFYKKQRATMNAQQRKVEGQLQELSDRIANWNRTRQGSGHTEESVRRKIRTWTTREHLREFLDLHLEREGDHVVDLSWTWNLTKKRQVQRRYLGKQILVTDRDDWEAVDVVTAYRRLARTEDLFRIGKSRPGLWWPLFHWTDSKIRVHALYCFFALLLVSILRLQLRQAGLTLSVEGALKQLAGIRESRVIYANGATDRVLSDLNQENYRLADMLGLLTLAREWDTTVLEPA